MKPNPEQPDPNNMHGAADGFGGQDYPPASEPLGVAADEHSEARYLTDDRDWPERKQNELVISVGGNGDWYIATVPKGELAFGRSVRICTSGGASSVAPGLCPAIAKAFASIKGTIQPTTPPREPAEGATPLTDALTKELDALAFRRKGNYPLTKMSELAESLETALAEAKAQLAAMEMQLNLALHKPEKWLALRAENERLAEENEALNGKLTAAILGNHCEVERLAALVAELERERDAAKKQVAASQRARVRPLKQVAAIVYDRLSHEWTRESVISTITALVGPIVNNLNSQLTAAQAQIAAMSESLNLCANILDRLVRPNPSESVSTIWAQAVDAEAKARAALSPSCGAELLATESAGMQLARREIDSALHHLPQEYVIQHEDPFAAMVLTFNKLAHAIKGLTARNAKLEGDADLLTFLIKQGPPRDGFDCMGLNEEVWEVASGMSDDELNTDQLAVRAALQARRQALDSAQEGRGA